MFRWGMFIPLLATLYNNHLTRHSSSNNNNNNKMGFKEEVEEDWGDRSRGRGLVMSRRCLGFRSSIL